jgi:hypothetical protein
VAKGAGIDGAGGGRVGIDGAAEDPVKMRLRPSPRLRTGHRACSAPLLLCDCWRRDGRWKGEADMGMRMRLPV